MYTCACVHVCVVCVCMCLIQRVYCICILCIVNVNNCKALWALVRKGALEMLVIIIIIIIIIIITFRVCVQSCPLHCHPRLCFCIWTWNAQRLLTTKFLRRRSAAPYMVGSLETVAYTILSPYGLYLYLHMYRCGCILGDPHRRECSSEERYNNNNLQRK